MSAPIRRTVAGRSSGLSLSVLDAGPEDGPLVILLHGFPETGASWGKQIEALAGAGWRVAAPDGRGYGDSAKPPGVAAYAIDHLVDDVLDVAAALGRASFAAVGHDWGGLVAWWLAATRPGRVERLAVLNAPHPAVVQSFIRRHPTQLLRSWYVAAFQIPGLPEWLLARRDHAAMVQAVTDSARPGLFAPAELDRLREAWGRPGALTAMLNWYRALPRHPPRTRDPRVTCPCRVLWGMRDRFLDARLADASLELCARGSLVRFAHATHWLHHEEPEAVSREIIAFLSA